MRIAWPKRPDGAASGPSCARHFVDGCYESFERTLVSLAEHNADDGLLSVRIGPHAPYTCSPRTIERSMELCERYGLGVHVHLSETLDEIDVVRQRYGKSPVEYLRDLGVFSFPTLAAHCVHVDEKAWRSCGTKA